MIDQLLKAIEQTETSNLLTGEFESGTKHLAVSGIEDNLMILMTLLKRNPKENTLLVCENDLVAEKLAGTFNQVLPDCAVYFHSEPSHYYFIDSHSRDITDERIESIHKLLFETGRIFVVPLETLFKKLINPSEYCQYYIPLKLGQVVELDSLIQELLKLGYKRCEVVENKGEFSIRGGIVDVFNVIDDYPLRFEFFDEEVDSIRVFDPETQRSKHKINKAVISPATEVIFDKSQLEIILQKADQDLDVMIKRAKGERRDNLKELREKLQNRQLNSFEMLMPYYDGETSSIVDYFNKNERIVFLDSDRFKDKYVSFFNQLKEDFDSLLEKGTVTANFFERFYTLNDLVGFLEDRYTLDFKYLKSSRSLIKPSAMVEANSKEVYSFYGKVNEFINQLSQWKKENYTVVIVAENSERCRNIADMLFNYNIISQVSSREIALKKVNIIEGTLPKGFVLFRDKFAVLSEGDIFRVKASKKNKNKRKKKGRKIESFTELNVGDYIVHDVHGIGVYMGIEQLTVDGVKKDYLHLKYAKGDKLYIPVDQLDSVQAYIGLGEKKPRINKLGSNEWKKSKQNAKQSVKDMAEELIKIYAQRRQSKGYAFSKDNEWTKEFDDKFPYEETADQLQAISEVKADMEKDAPMDRLICGDVGYGKTEVAIRASFKCIMDNKQVAILVPTTLLAQQHYNSFLQRFEDYPVKIEMLSRFRSKKEQEHIIQDLKKNRVDIVIGTHRLLSKDVSYCDLGLLIIDEEQRFGVRHKEKIKELKANVDVLTLSATPIPRTLHMSLIGARDMSILNEPPQNRTPVQTYVMEYDEVLIRDAINRELARNGQVYYVYNRVQDIDNVAAKVAKMIPKARIAIAHGKMTETRLEDIMIDFMNREYDILVCTTIIESGLDIPNANTIVIENADHMGLSQLYQLRGRVGRSERLSYAYITYKRDKSLSEVAEKRLKAIKDFTEFGSGFKIAMRDLEIRGAGNILGSRQHGHLASVGYDMYCKLLDEAVKELKGQDTLPEVNTVIELNVDAYIPSRYVKSEKQKYQLYKKIVGIESQKELFDIEEEIEDRYGDLPKSVQNLLYISYIKKMSSEIGIKKLRENDSTVVMTFDINYFLTKDQIKELIKFYPIKFTTESSGETSVALKKSKTQNNLIQLKEFLEKIKSTKPDLKQL